MNGSVCSQKQSARPHRKPTLLWFFPVLMVILTSLSFEPITPVANATSVGYWQCTTTVIVQKGVGIIPDSEITKCEFILGTPGSKPGLVIPVTKCGDLPCPGDGPQPDDPAIDDAIKCRIKQFKESKKDQLARSLTAQIATRDQSREHGTFIVEVDGKVMALDIVDGSSDHLSRDDMGRLYAQLYARGYNFTHIVGFIHNHPPANHPYPDMNRDEDFINGFPSDNDYIAYRTFADNAVIDRANRATWEANFSAYIIGPDRVLREYEGLTQPASQDFSKGIPKPGTAAYQNLQKQLDAARKDAEGKC